MVGFYVNGDSGTEFRIGNSLNKITDFPISNLISVSTIDVINVYGSITINAQSQKDVSFTVEARTINDNIFIPIAIIGYDVSMAYYCAFQKMFLSNISGSDNKTANIRFTNNGSSNYTTSRFFIYVLYVQKTCGWLS